MNETYQARTSEEKANRNAKTLELLSLQGQTLGEMSSRKIGLSLIQLPPKAVSAS